MPEPKPQETALVVAEPQAKQQLTSPRTASPYIPQNVTEAMALAKMIAASDLATKEFRGKPGNVMIAMQMGAEVGLAPMQAIQNIAVINGRPSVWGDAALGIVQVHPAYEWHKERIEGEGDKMVAVCEIKRKGHEVHIVRFSVDDAKTAKLWNKKGYEGKDTPWVTSPKRMLQMRARGFALRDKFADALRGLILAEEAMDIPPEPKRERGTLDADALKTLTPSEEPNRGHGNEGTEQPQAVTPPPEAPKPSNLVRGVVTVTTVEPRMKKVTQAMIDKAKKEGKPEPQPQEYFVLHTSDENGNEAQVASWHKHLHEYVVKMQGKVCDITIERRVKPDETVTYALEHIHQIGDQHFLEDKPIDPSMTGDRLFK